MNSINWNYNAESELKIKQFWTFWRQNWDNCNKLTWEEVCTGSGWKWTDLCKNNIFFFFLIFYYVRFLFVKHILCQLLTHTILWQLFIAYFSKSKDSFPHYQKIERSHSCSRPNSRLNLVWADVSITIFFWHFCLPSALCQIIFFFEQHFNSIFKGKYLNETLDFACAAAWNS